jgi:hypothetical protein
MSFGFAVGDFIAVGKLVCDIVSSLRSIGGASSEYQELIRRLESLDQTLCHALRLELKAGPSDILNSITFEVQSCRAPLDELLLSIRKYQKTLGQRSVSHIVRATADKLSWTFLRKHDIKKLEASIDRHVNNINMLLTEYAIEQIDLNDRKAEVRAGQLGQQLVDAKESSLSQARILRNMQWMLGSLYNWVRGDMNTAMQHFCGVVNKV